VKPTKKGFTTVELLTVLAIIMLLVGIMLPALKAVKDRARRAKQKAEFLSMDMALLAFKGDYGDFPPSLRRPDYNGANKLTEALLGRDLLGFNPKTQWLSDDDLYIDISDPSAEATQEQIEQRKDPYLDISTARPFLVRDLYDDPTTLYPWTYLLCDVFPVKTISRGGETVKAGTPILYYKANPSNKTIRSDLQRNKRTYNAGDNFDLTSRALSIVSKETIEHPLGYDADNFQVFYDYITNPKVQSAVTTYNPDSYILISAGPDGLYGTGDDITNFGK
jgi:type II secretory pathway pseudopilin PulG